MVKLGGEKGETWIIKNINDGGRMQLSQLLNGKGSSPL